MGKPKENTIGKIDTLAKVFKKQDVPGNMQELVTALAGRCHRMNIHKAKLVYFKDIKLVLTKCLAALETGEMENECCRESLEKELIQLLHIKNG